MISEWLLTVAYSGLQMDIISYSCDVRSCLQLLTVFFSVLTVCLQCQAFDGYDSLVILGCVCEHV